MSHPYNISRATRNIDYITKLLISLKNELQYGMNLNPYLNKLLPHNINNEYTLNDILINDYNNLKFDFVVFGGGACEKWLSILDINIFKKFIKLYPTEDIDVNLVYDLNQLKFNYINYKIKPRNCEKFRIDVNKFISLKNNLQTNNLELLVNESKMDDSLIFQVIHYNQTIIELCDILNIYNTSISSLNKQMFNYHIEMFIQHGYFKLNNSHPFLYNSTDRNLGKIHALIRPMPQNILKYQENPTHFKRLKNTTNINLVNETVNNLEDRSHSRYLTTNTN